jgi:pre-60S factor REI1
VQFPSAEDQREHYRSDWHKYNLKRKVANMPPVTAENFQERLVAQQDKTLAQQAAENYSGKCKACGKTYSSENAYKEHLNSKKHKENAAKYVEPEVRTHW